MLIKKNIQQKIKGYKICVIIPTYNNERTLKRVIDGVLHYSDDLIIINDGATDSTPEILKAYPEVNQIQIKPNKGKGNALRVGFKLAEELGFEYAITIDSDGQHFPDDIPVFVNKLESEDDKNLLLIGARNMTQEGIPGGSSFGHKFSNFWYRVETGIKLTDTQSGYRMYPLKSLNNIKFYTKKFEFEIENIVKASWIGIIVKNVPIKVLYDESERVTHFRPIKDFTRISLLNLWLVIVAFFYIKPRNLIRRLRKKGFRRFIKEDLLASNDSPLKKSQAIALGVFIGLTPLWGLHAIIALSLAHFFKLNKAIAFTFTNISIPPITPFIILFSLEIGALILGDDNSFTILEIQDGFNFKQSIVTYVVGSFSLAIIGAILFGLVSYLLLSLNAKKKQH